MNEENKDIQAPDSSGEKWRCQKIQTSKPDVAENQANAGWRSGLLILTILLIAILVGGMCRWFCRDEQYSTCVALTIIERPTPEMNNEAGHTGRSLGGGKPCKRSVPQTKSVLLSRDFRSVTNRDSPRRWTTKRHRRRIRQQRHNQLQRTHLRTKRWWLHSVNPHLSFIIYQSKTRKETAQPESREPAWLDGENQSAVTSNPLRVSGSHATSEVFIENLITEILGIVRKRNHPIGENPWPVSRWHKRSGLKVQCE